MAGVRPDDRATGGRGGADGRGAGACLALCGLLAALAVMLAATFAQQAWAGTVFDPAPGSPFAAGIEEEGYLPAPNAVAVGDLNGNGGDGRLDVVAAIDEGVSVLMGAGDGTLSFKETHELSSTFDGPPVIADFNKDGNPDIAWPIDQDNKTYEEAVSVLLGNGDGTFQDELDTKTGIEYPERMAVGDFNGDEKPDVAVIGFTNLSEGEKVQLSVMLGDGAGAFSAPKTTTVYEGEEYDDVGPVFAEDFNGDGKVDVLVVTRSEAALYPGKGDGIFEAPIKVASPGGVAATVADFNGDGRPDIALVSSDEEGNSGTLEVFTHDAGADFGFTKTFSLPCENYCEVPTAGDLDGDGVPDLIVPGIAEEASTSWLHGNGNGTFGAPDALPRQVSTYTAVLPDDMNGDGRADLVFAQDSETEEGGYVAGVGVMLNGAAAAPTAVTGGASAIGLQEATVAGSVNPNGRATSWWFEYGATTAYGYRTEVEQAGSGGGTAPVSAPLEGLSPSTVYHYRLVARSDAGTSYGADATLQTTSLPPTVQIGPVSSLAAHQATVSATVDPKAGSTSYHFEYGTTRALGSSTPVGSLPPDSQQHSVSAKLSGLKAATLYFFTIVATNGGGTSRGQTGTFETPNKNGTVPGGYLSSGATLAFGPATPLLTTFTLTTGCPIPKKPCDARLFQIQLRFTAHGSVGALARHARERLSSPHPPDYEAFYGDYYDLPLKGANHHIAPGKQVKLKGKIPSEMWGPISEVLANGGAVEITVTAVDKDRAPVAFDTKVLTYAPAAVKATRKYLKGGKHGKGHAGKSGKSGKHDRGHGKGRTGKHGKGHHGKGHHGKGGKRVKASQASGRIAAETPPGEVVGVEPVKLVGKFASYQVSVSGKQVTQWYYSLQGEGNGEACDSGTWWSKGDGQQTITFSTTPTRALVGGFHLEQLPGEGAITVLNGIGLYSNEGHAPLELPAMLDVTRRGIAEAGATRGCGEGAGEEHHSDCGERILSGKIQMEMSPYAAMSGTQWESYTQQVPNESQTYAACPFEGFSEYVSGLELMRVLERKLQAKQLFGKGAPPVGKTISFTVKDQLARKLAGGTSVTSATWNVKLTRIGTVICHRTGNSVACLDEKAKKQAKKEAAEYKKSYEEVQTYMKALECGPGTEAKWACNMRAAQSVYDSVMEQKELAIAHDPPSRDYRRVAKPTPQPLAAIEGEGAPPAVVKLRENETQTLGLLEALFYTINRASGADQAGDAGALARQNAAALRYGGEIAKLLSQQKALLEAAVSEVLPELSAQQAASFRKAMAASVAPAAGTAKLLRGFSRQHVQKSSGRGHKRRGHKRHGHEHEHHGHKRHGHQHQEGKHHGNKRGRHDKHKHRGGKR